MGREMVHKSESVRPGALLWQSQIENKTRIPHVPDEVIDFSSKEVDAHRIVTFVTSVKIHFATRSAETELQPQ